MLVLHSDVGEKKAKRNAVEMTACGRRSRDTRNVRRRDKSVGRETASKDVIR